MEFDNPLPGVPDVESPFFEALFAAKDLPPTTLAIARSLHERGYAVIDFPDTEFEARAERIRARLGAGFDFDHWRAVLHPAHDGLRAQDAWTSDPDVRAIAANPVVLRLLGELYGRPAFPFQTLNFATGTQQAVHSDTAHFSSAPEGFMCGVWVALEDVDDDNGALVYYPGSHRLPHYTNEQLGVLSAVQADRTAHYGHYVRLWRELAEVHGLKAETFHARKGQALIWSARLLHGGALHRDTGRTRWSQVTHYYFDGCVHHTPLLSDPLYGAPYYRDVVDIVTGEARPNMLSGHQVPDEVIARARGDPTSLRSRLRRRLGRLRARLTGRA